MSETESINHDIDVRYETDVIEAFNKFIEKWCPRYYAHLIDDDENDGEFIREKIVAASQRQVIEARLDELERRYGSTNHGARWEERFDELTAQLAELDKP